MYIVSYILLYILSCISSYIELYILSYIVSYIVLYILSYNFSYFVHRILHCIVHSIVHSIVYPIVSYNVLPADEQLVQLATNVTAVNFINNRNMSYPSQDIHRTVPVWRWPGACSPAPSEVPPSLRPDESRTANNDSSPTCGEALVFQNSLPVSMRALTPGEEMNDLTQPVKKQALVLLLTE